MGSPHLHWEQLQERGCEDALPASGSTDQSPWLSQALSVFLASEGVWLAESEVGDICSVLLFLQLDSVCLAINQSITYLSIYLIHLSAHL